MLSFVSMQDAKDYKEANPYKFRSPHRCELKPSRWHLSTHGSFLRKLEEELHTEMASRKAISDRIVQYMRNSYERNKTTKFSSQMVTFAIQQETPNVTKQVIAEVISSLKNREKKIVSLNEKVPDQKGAVYFTLAEILEKETEPKKMTEVKTIPAQEKPKNVPLNPFDKVHDKLDQLSVDVASLVKIFQGGVLSIESKLSDAEVKIETDDMDSIATAVVNRVGPRLDALSHVTVDGDKLADVINARLQNLKLEDSFIIKLDEQTDNLIDRRLREYTDHINTLLDRQGATLLKYLETLKAPKEVSNEDDYRVGVKDGIKDGIRMALEMGLKLDD